MPGAGARRSCSDARSGARAVWNHELADAPEKASGGFVHSGGGIRTRDDAQDPGTVLVPRRVRSGTRGQECLTASISVTIQQEACRGHGEDKGERIGNPQQEVRLTPAVKAGADGPPTCEHGRWQFAGSDYKRKAAKWRCPTKECKPGSRWIKASRLHTLIPRDSDRWRKLYRGRAAVEREFGRSEARMEPADHPRARYRAGPATRRPDDPRQVACALAKARAVPLAAQQ